MYLRSYERSIVTGRPNYEVFRGVEITALVLALIFVILRLANRIRKKNLSWDDLLLVVAATLAVIITVLVLRLFEHGYGKLEDQIPAANKIPIGKLSMAIFTTFPLCYALIRSSIILTYLRLFPAQTNKWFCYALFAVQGIYAIWAGLMVLLQCKPVKGYWLADVDKTCIDPQNQDIAILVLNSTFDIIVYTWPAHYLYKLNLPVKSRVGLIFLFSIGVVNIGVGFTRLSLLLAMYTTKEWTKYGIWGCMCIVLEANIGIMCACLPYLKFIYDFVTKSIFPSIAASFNASHSRVRSRSKTKSKSSDPNHGHPFHELNDEGIQRKTEITLSTADEDEDRPVGVPKNYVRNAVVRNDIRRMENEFEQKQKDAELHKSGSGESALLESGVSHGR